MKTIFNNQFLFFKIKGRNQYENVRNRTVYNKTIRNNILQLKGLAQLFILLALVTILPFQSFGQGGTNEAEWNGGGYSLKKIVSNTTIASGINFSYTIMFTAPAGATTVNITDAIPTNLVVVSLPTPAIVNGVTPTLTVAGTPMVNEVVSYSLSSLPSGSASSGSFTIVVKFPEGITCNGAAARNQAKIFTDDWHETPFVSTTATAADPWKVVKSIISGPVVNPSGGSCGYLMSPGDTVTYRLSVLKNYPYYGNVVGQQNMTSAVVTDVLPAGAIMLTSTCGIPANSTGTITWQPNSGNLNGASAYAYYYCDITVYYPAASFPVSTIINNQLDLDGIMCGQQVSHTSNQTCIEVANIVANPSGYFQKYISLTNRVPGCTGVYTIAFCNNGNVPLSAFNIDDIIPSGVSVDKVAVYGANATTSIDLSANSGANSIATGLSSYFSPTTIGYTVNDLQLQMTSSLPVGACIYLYVYFTVEPNPTGTIVTNCATFNGLSNGLTLPQTCDSFTVDAGAPHPCLVKDVCSPQPSYDPGDIIRFRIRVQNIGSADITGASFQDNLHSNFTYVGNESYYIANTYNPACSSGGGIPSGTTAWTGVTAVHSGNNLSWTLPDIPSDCQLFYVAYCGYYGTWGLPYYFVEFDVMVDSMAMPGVTPNNYDISGGNLTGVVTSNTTNTLIVASFGQEVYKQVSTDNGTTFNSSGTVSPGGSARYRLNYKNTSNVTVSSVNLVDLLPMNDGTNDWLILNRSVSRGSQFSVGYNNTHSTSLVPTSTAPTPTLNFASGLNICLPPFGISSGCTTTSWGTSPDQNIRIDYGAYLLGSNVTIREDFNVTIPSNATYLDTACNDFAAISTADFLLDGTPTTVALTPIAAPPICIVVDTASSVSCCDSIEVRQFVDAYGTPGCCTEIITKCEVDSILVIITNGTFSSNNWNCTTPIPTAAIGQSSYTFVANNCVVDMTNCYDAKQTGIVGVSYLVYFANGEKCEKSIEIDCEATIGDCCKGVKLEPVQDPAAPEACCARLVTNCEVDSIFVQISNGTFASATWNCGAIPSGYIGQSSYTFNASLCVADMTTCVTPYSTGVVTINYIIFFQNGEECEKYIHLDCVAPKVICCDSVEVRQSVDADGTPGCCTEIITNCEVDSIQVSVTNGTFSSNSWSCTSPISTAAIGQSNYTFASANCVVNMTNCINPDQTGIVTVNYTIYFTNGEICEKSLQLDCVKVVENCCDSIRIEIIQDPAVAGDCCVRLITDCEVDSVSVNIGNGTISTVTWNCGAIPAGYTGQSSYTFDANLCVVDMITCVTPQLTGTVTLTYTVYFQNGESCDKTVDLDCKVDVNCCDSVKVEQVVNSAGKEECCVKISTTCEVESIAVTVTNGTISSANWNCGTVPSGYSGLSSHTFQSNACIVEMTNCFDAIQTGPVTINYVITFIDGTTCEKSITIDCEKDPSTCCALVDFKLKQKWPHFSTQVGTFTITNLDPSAPICSVTISASPAASFTTGGLVIDGVTSTQTWNSSSIPASGSLSPTAVNSMIFSLIGVNYHGTITVCVIKCDGTECCFEFKWNKKIIIDIGIEIGQLPTSDKLVAVTVNPVVTTITNDKVKYVSFGMRDEQEILEKEPEFFAISASEFQGDGYPESLMAPVSAYMGKHNAFFELSQAKMAGEDLGAFNLVFSKMLPKLACTLFDEEGNIIFSGDIDVTLSDTLNTSSLKTSSMNGNLFEFIKLYPNPSQGAFNVTYATGSQNPVEIRVINPLGQVIEIIDSQFNTPGIHNVNVNVFGFSSGLYKVALYSEGKVLSKSALIKE